MSNCIGVLALQGAYQKQVESLAKFDVEFRLIRKSAELDHCSGLIIPGGESTTMSLLIREAGLYGPLSDFALHNPVMGVCAGMIMMAETVDDERVNPLKIIPFHIERNHYGRQVNSFMADIKLDFEKSCNTFNAFFIRAPVASNLSLEIKVLATYNDKAVMIGVGKHIAVSFHPELTNDTRILKYWLSNF